MTPTFSLARLLIVSLFSNRSHKSICLHSRTQNTQQAFRPSSHRRPPQMAIVLTSRSLPSPPLVNIFLLFFFFFLFFRLPLSLSPFSAAFVVDND
ncbi:hypothetical protein CsatB_022824 [Cannabis sativa]